MSYQLLSEPIRRYVRDQGWDELRPIQNAAALRILTTEDDYILASRTASGKTEAAFLPILSKIDFEEPGVQVVYISPLKALINDQFQRIEDLCKYLDVTVTKWHGEASRTLKERLIREPHGIVLITPESLEAMFANKPYNVPVLFSNLKFVVIDEIHSFIGTDRGTHLRSILSRLSRAIPSPFRLVGLSATIGDFEESKKFAGRPESTKVLLDRTARGVEGEFKYFEESGSELPIDLMKDLYREVRDAKVLVFPNSRGRTEEIAVKLKKIAEKLGDHTNYFSHHSSVDRDVREYIEFFAKSTKRENFAIACTSTLELGIDIGSVDKVAQINATNSVSSLIQRVGRSGRKEGKKGRLVLYATDRWSMLQSLAGWSLFLDGIIEPPNAVLKPYDILVHQALSVVKGLSSVSRRDLIEELRTNHAFASIEVSEIESAIEHLMATEILELVRDEVIIGLEGEKSVNSRDFYSVFETEHLLKVVCNGRPIGQIPMSPQIVPGENILLAARIWTIKHIDFTSMTIDVDKAAAGRSPIFGGVEAGIHGIIRQRMLEVLYSSQSFQELDNPSRDELDSMRMEFSAFPIRDLTVDRPFVEKETSREFFTFLGSKANNALMLFLQMADIAFGSHSRASSFEIKGKATGIELSSDLIPSEQRIDEYLAEQLIANPPQQAFTKWSRFVPIELQVRLLKERSYDIEAASAFLNSSRWIGSEAADRNSRQPM